MIVLPRPAIFRLKRRSLLRGTLLALSAFVASLLLGGFPDINKLHSSSWQIVPALAAFTGMFETARCLDRRWSLRHAAVLILLYTDLMILALAVVLFIYP